MFWSFNKTNPFADFLKAYKEDATMELLEGTAVQRMLSNSYHDELVEWMVEVLGGVAEEGKLGVFFGCETLVQIHERRARRPDLSFVAANNQKIVREGVIYGAPNLVIEVVGSGDLLSDVMAREKDYREREISEILFVDQSRRRLRVVRRQGEWIRKRRADAAGWTEEVIATRAPIPLYSLGSFVLRTEWLFVEPRPTLAEVRTSSSLVQR